MGAVPPTNCSRAEGAAAADPAFMLFGKPIKGLLPKQIKEEFSPRGVDERGLSLATSSDEEEDLNEIAQASCCQVAKQESDKQQSTTNNKMCIRGGMLEVVEKHTIPERELNMEAAKRQSGLWSQCPRCNSTDTKFCYFNNYNVNQPRHFCKHCQRYWTAGGTLRNVPVGAGRRKNKHALRKEAFLTSPLCGSNKMASLDVAGDGTESIRRSRSHSVDVNVDVLADGGPIWNSDLPIPEGPSPMVKMPSVNTDLNLCAHQSTSTSSTQHQLTSSNTFPSHKPHSLSTLQQLQVALPSPFCPTLASGSSNSSEAYSNLADRLVYPTDASGASSQIVSGSCSRSSQGRPDGCCNSSQLCPQLASGSAELCQISPHFGSESSRSNQSELSGGSCHPDDSLNLENGFAKRTPDMANCSSQECLHLQKQKEAEQPITHQNSASPGSGHLPGLAKTCSSVDQGLRVPAADVWPYFYNMYWVDTVGSLGLKPILTPQGWAFPFIPPSIQPSSSFTTQPTLQKSEFSQQGSNSKSTSCIPSPPSFISTHAPLTPTICKDVPSSAFSASIPSCGKRSANVSQSSQSECHHRSYKCSKSEH